MALSLGSNLVRRNCEAGLPCAVQPIIKIVDRGSNPVMTEIPTPYHCTLSYPLTFKERPSRPASGGRRRRHFRFEVRCRGLVHAGGPLRGLSDSHRGDISRRSDLLGSPSGRQRVVWATSPEGCEGGTLCMGRPSLRSKTGNNQVDVSSGQYSIVIELLDGPEPIEGGQSCELVYNAVSPVVGNAMVTTGMRFDCAGLYTLRAPYLGPKSTLTRTSPS